MYNDNGDTMKSSNEQIQYVEVDQDNLEIAYEIQKTIWTSEPDYQSFYRKIAYPDIYEKFFIVYFDNQPIGITGTYTEDFDLESIWLDWYGILPEYRGNGYGKIILLDTIRYCREFKQFLYFRLDTTYWENRPAVCLYDKVMDLKEDYTIEDTETEKHGYLIYTYNLKRTGYTKPWNNRFIGLVEHYNECHE